MACENPVMWITGSRKGIGKHLAQYYSGKGFCVVGCSRQPADWQQEGYEHVCVDVSDEAQVIDLAAHIRKTYGRLDVALNNAGIASMNHALLTPGSTVQRVFQTNFMGTFNVCRESAKLMLKRKWGRIVNFSTVAVPLHLEGEAVYAASKGAVEELTRVLARELGSSGITVNAVGPTPIDTDLTRNVPKEKMEQLVSRLAIKRAGAFEDVAHVIDFFIQAESDAITGQVIYLGGV
jgi:3-oxoacyl-[acyl-carrier protein] reductase